MAAVPHLSLNIQILKPTKNLQSKVKARVASEKFTYSRFHIYIYIYIVSWEEKFQHMAKDDWIPLCKLIKRLRMNFGNEVIMDTVMDQSHNHEFSYV